MPISKPSRDYRLGQLCEELGIVPMDLGTLLSRYELRIDDAETPAPKHCCGAYDFNAMLGHRCPACEFWHDAYVAYVAGRRTT